MKSKILNLGLVFTMLLVMLSPVYAASKSSDWSFVMDYRLVDGYDNGEIHNLKKGTMSLSGSFCVYSKDDSAVESPYRVYFSVRKIKDWGVDDFIGETSKTPSETLHEDVEVEGAFGEQEEGQYYLQIYTANDDGWNTAGSGTLSNE